MWNELMGKTVEEIKAMGYEVDSENDMFPWVLDEYGDYMVTIALTNGVVNNWFVDFRFV